MEFSKCSYHLFKEIYTDIEFFQVWELLDTIDFRQLVSGFIREQLHKSRSSREGSSLNLAICSIWLKAGLKGRYRGRA